MNTRSTQALKPTEIFAREGCVIAQLEPCEEVDIQGAAVEHDVLVFSGSHFDMDKPTKAYVNVVGWTRMADHTYKLWLTS